MDRGIEKTCEVCFERRRGDNLREKIEKYRILEREKADVNKQQIDAKQSSMCSINMDEVEKSIDVATD